MVFYLGQTLDAAGVHAGFKLRDRALHVFSEAARVPEFKEACDSKAHADQKLLELARLMDLSHASCRCAESSGPSLNYSSDALFP